jgi:hypothetical protein
MKLYSRLRSWCPGMSRRFFKLKRVPRGARCGQLGCRLEHVRPRMFQPFSAGMERTAQAPGGGGLWDSFVDKWRE